MCFKSCNRHTHNSEYDVLANIVDKHSEEIQKEYVYDGQVEVYRVEFFGSHICKYLIFDVPHFLKGYVFGTKIYL